MLVQKINYRQPIILLIIGTIICLTQVLTPHYFLTGDGPCHLYNARMLHDYWTDANQPFYRQFYTLLKVPNPNWFTTIAFAGFMYIFSPVWSEKVLICIYVLLFITGFYKLIKAINPKVTYLVLLIPLIVFNHPLFKGFYNFSLSISLFFWVCYFFIQFIKTHQKKNLYLLAALTIITFFCHPLGVIYSWIIESSIGLFLLIKAIKEHQLKPVSYKILLIILFQLPVLFVFYWFIQKQGLNTIQLHLDLNRTGSLLGFQFLITHNNNEVIFIQFIAAVLMLFFLTTIIYVSIYKKQTLLFWGCCLSLIISLFIYFTFPDWLLGGGLLVMRAQLYVFIIIILCIASVELPAMIEKTGSIILFTIFIVLSSLRLVSILNCSSGIDNFMQVQKYIEPNNVILNLIYAPNGITADKKQLANSNWLFFHHTGYIGAEKPSILLDNYEANSGLFPFLWKELYNPYRDILNKEDGIEGHPPFADIEAYNKIRIINYIIVWGYDEKYNLQDQTVRLWKQINKHYTLLYETKDKRTILFKYARF